MLHIAMLSTACLIFMGCIKVAGSSMLNSNAIKVGSGAAGSSHPVSPSPDVSPADSGSLNFALDTPQVSIHIRISYVRQLVVVKLIVYFQTSSSL